MITGAQAAHATLISGVGPAPAFGSVSVYSFALGASAVLLALVVMKSQEPLNLRRRRADLWKRAALAGARRTSRIRRRVDLLLLRMLGDNAGGRPVSRPDRPGAAGEPRSYHSKHRLAGPPKEPLTTRRAPRHAIPPAGRERQPPATQDPVRTGTSADPATRS